MTIRFFALAVIVFLVASPAFAQLDKILKGLTGSAGQQGGLKRREGWRRFKGSLKGRY